MNAGENTKLPVAELRTEVAKLDWYHTLELAPGVVTPGWFDHRSIVHKVPLPGRLDGKRCLDVGTFNGHWAFQLERRGAAEVVAVDVLDPAHWDWPVGSDPAAIAEISKRMEDGNGFELARAALDSNVTRHDCSVYDLNPEQFGEFDVVYVGSLLVHLRDPVRALEAVRSVCAGELVLVDGIDLPLTLKAPHTPVFRLDGAGRPWWFTANLAGLGRIVEAAGFELTSEPSRLYVPPGAGWNPSRRAVRGLFSRTGREALIGAWKGDPHGVITARPRSH